ncbi:PilT/PilU family type 4a pilus ATPase [Aquihabitans sp. McL0605]|uniref:PilT/PilU family type 4a pilus ATPase n=1 Tax=Aquihabitans sp. McL0605 TaxID=3415671 RepID=UPI003CED1EA7
MLNSQARRFGEALVDRHVITREAMDAALDESSRTGVLLPAVLESSVALPAADLAAAWAAATGAEYVDMGSEVIHPEALAILPEELIVAHRAIPIRLDQAGLLVAFSAPAVAASVRAIADHLVAAGGPDLIVGLTDDESITAAIADLADGSGPHDAQHGGSTRNDNTTELYRLFDRLLGFGASDLHLAVGEPPFMRVVGDLIRMPDEPALTATRIRELVYSILSVRQQAKFEETRELDTSHAMGAKVRFRVNVFLQRNAVGAAFRVIPYEVVDFDVLGLPPVARTVADLPRGLVLVTGPTGSGKSTTLASLVDIVNRTRHCHIMTIEDPIEFVHRPKVALINQREVGEDTLGFGVALTSAMRQDPDVILVGEMRDLETISTAITAAETGHLVFATLHTQDAAQTVDRIIDVFPGEQQGQVRVQLANSLQAVITQQLLPSVDGRSRVAACELMFANNAIRALIREGKVHQIHNAMASGKRAGMQTMDDSLADLVRRGMVEGREAVRRAKNPDELGRAVGLAPLPPPPTGRP